MHHAIKLGLIAASTAVIIFYGLSILDTAKYLDVDVKYIGPLSGVAYEDILGFGFYPMAAIVSIVMAALSWGCLSMGVPIKYPVIAWVFLVIEIAIDYNVTFLVERLFLHK